MNDDSFFHCTNGIMMDNLKKEFHEHDCHIRLLNYVTIIYIIVNFSNLYVIISKRYISLGF